jgi:hypothetical protein
LLKKAKQGSTVSFRKIASLSYAFIVHTNLGENNQICDGSSDRSGLGKKKKRNEE